MPNNLADTLIAIAYRWPETLAVDAPEQRLTYRQLAQKASCLAGLIETAGLAPGSRIAIALTRNDEALIAMLGAWIAGCTALVTDFRSRAAERSKIAAAMDIQLFLEDRPAPGKEPYPALALEAGWDRNSNDQPIRLAPPDANHVAVIGVFSGTSGTPQPVALSHDCLYARCAIARTSPQWNSGGRFLVTAPLAFSATRKHVLSRLLDGGTVIFTSLLVSPEEIVRRVHETNANAMLTVPIVARQLMALAPPDQVLFPDMEWMMCCGAPMTPQEKIDARLKLCSGFVQNYGSTMAGMITLLETKDIEQHSESVGRPLPHVLTQVVDADNNPLPPGNVGQIRVRTPGIGAELATPSGAPPKRQSDLILDGWIYPGDIGMLDDAGFLHIVGRSSDLIIRAGVNVYPAEIEDVLSAHPAVMEAAVVGWPDSLLGEEIAAFVVLSGQASDGELLGWCRSKLQPDKQPRQIFIITEMPRNSNGKIVKRELSNKLPAR